MRAYDLALVVGRSASNNARPPLSLIHHREHSTDGTDKDDFDDQCCRDSKDAYYRLGGSITCTTTSG